MSSLLFSCISLPSPQQTVSPLYLSSSNGVKICEVWLLILAWWEKKDKVSCSKMLVTLVKDVCFSFLQFQRTPLPFANGSFYKGVRHIKVYDCYHAYISVSYFFLAIN